jgi:hypothetical protein
LISRRESKLEKDENKNLIERMSSRWHFIDSEGIGQKPHPNPIKDES